MEKLTKAALVEHMVKEMGEGVTKKEAATALDALCRVIPAQMAMQWFCLALVLWK